MDSLTLIAVASIVIGGLTTGFGCMGPAFAEGRAVATALTALAQQPDASATITRSGGCLLPSSLISPTVPCGDAHISRPMGTTP